MTYRVAALLVFVCLLAAACGSDATETSPEATSASPRAPAAAGATPIAANVQATALPTQTPRSRATSAPTSTPTPAPTTPPAADAATVSASIQDFKHQDLSVAIGTTVTWTQSDAASHTTTSGSPGNPDGIWDSGRLSNGGTFSHTFTETGELLYYCSIHPSMKATIKIVEAMAEAGKPTGDTESSNGETDDLGY